jgi:hypothetical protein
MALLELPNELFDPIFHLVVDALAVEKAVELRLICSKFSSSMCNRQRLNPT